MMREDAMCTRYWQKRADGLGGIHGLSLSFMAFEGNSVTPVSRMLQYYVNLRLLFHLNLK